ncbi:RNA-dependent RNA polymerase [Blattodean arli-related virus OKIAV102]|uniref:RNA-directed RNA polymerase L n=1 Tax=Blattodean arli-related virus OKIAV102 TaxID=2746352 RepID=A0ABX6QUW9_9MONO|nr:RNA-dependent RNA polymerase [Blattodean arli-related virus OKIAV102]QMP82242.1 RNA-dependent RNA polymerase [Blattodean arli-related virus OKIAV102]
MDTETDSWEEALQDLFPTSNTPIKIPDSHLQSPLRIETRKFLLIGGDSVPKFLQGVIESCPINRGDLVIDSEHTYGYLLSSVVRNPPVPDSFTVTHYVEAIDVLRTHITLMMKELNLPGPASHFEYTHQHLSWLTAKRRWNKLKEVMKSQRSTTKWYTGKIPLPGIGTYTYCGHYIIYNLDFQPDVQYVMDYDQVMMISDTTDARVLSIIYNDTLPDQIPGKLPALILQDLYAILDKCLCEKGNVGFEEIAMWESCCMAVFYKRYDRLAYSKEYVRWFEEEILMTESNSIQRVYTLLSESDLQPEQLAELHGIYRHWGHPTVLEALGCEKVRSIGTSRNMPREETVIKGAGCFKRQFIAAYIRQHGCWPKVWLPEGFEGVPLQKLITSQSTAINFYSPDLPIEHWAEVRFGKEFEFDYHADFTTLIEDKSVSCYRSEVRGIYNAEVLGYKPKKLTSHRRLLQEVLSRPEISVETYCQIVMRREVPWEWKIILIHAKERELKLPPRLFAMMVLEMRLYFCVTEVNISHNIFPYFPQQTMTLDEAELHKRLYYLSGNRDLPQEFLAALVIIDFSSWNLTWIKAATDLIFSMLDELHGTPGLYTYTHEFFSECLITLASHLNPPASYLGSRSGDPPPCNEVWYGHQSGFEGLRQKGWTLCTIALLLLVEQETGIKSYIIGQGDNQVCKILLPVPAEHSTAEQYLETDQESIDTIIRSYMGVLETRARELGLRIKAEETSVSTDVMIYGKEILYRGAYMPQGIKRISRTLPDTNETFSNLHTRVSTLQTAGFACAQKSLDLVTPYFVSSVEVLLTCVDTFHDLGQKGVFTKREVAILLSKRFKRFLTFLCSEVAAFPFLSFLHMLYRGCPDPFVATLTSLAIMGKSDKLARKIYTWLEMGGYPLGQGNPELLITNPKSVNIKVPRTLASSMKNRLISTLTRSVSNHHLMEIFSTSKLEEDAQLYSYLIQSNPVNPRVLHEIFRNSETGARLAFLTKFHNMKTLQGMFAQKGGLKTPFELVGTSIDRESIVHWLYLLDIIDGVKTGDHQLQDPTLLAQRIRDHSWGQVTGYRPIEGVTIPYPAHQFVCHPERGATAEHACREYLLFVPRTHDVRVLTTRGPYPAFVGSSTREKLTGKLYQLPITSRPLQGAGRLQQLRGWTIKPGTGLDQLMVNVIGTRTDLPIDVLEKASAEIAGGSVTHRLDDHVTKRGTLHNNRANHTTHLWFSSDHMGKFSRGQDNYNIHFQGAIHLGMSWFALNLVHAGQPIDCLRICFKCEACELRLDDELLTNDQPPPSLTTLPNNPLIFTCIEDQPVVVSRAEKRIIKYTKVGRPEQAIACILFTRILKHSREFLMGVNETISPTLVGIGVAEILSVGIDKIMESLAVYIFLSLPGSIRGAYEALSIIPPSVFSDLASICLLPEVLSTMAGMEAFRHGAELFWNKDTMCCILKGMLDRMVRGHIQLAAKSLRLVICHQFYLIPKIGQYKVMQMWARQVLLASAGKIDLTPILRDLKNTLSGTQRVAFEEELISHLSNLILRKHGVTVYKTLCDTFPIQISEIPAEIVAREGRNLSILRPLQRGRGSPVAHPILHGTYPLQLDCMRMSCQLGEIPYRPDLPIVTQVTKTRSDQTFRLHGQVSTTYYKLLEVLVKEKITDLKSVVTLAEGEGSIARLVWKFGARTIYYNTLLNRDKLLPHRASSIRPTYLSDAVVDLPWSETLAITGGDLCNSTTLAKLCRLLKGPVQLVTCDAESSTSFSWMESYKIVIAFLSCCVRGNSPYGIVKTFCNSDSYLQSVLGLVLIIYSEVRIVTPHFSSNEGYEVYLVCSKLTPLISLDTLYSWHQSPKAVRSMSAFEYSEALKNYRRRRVSPRPFQENLGAKIYQFWETARQLGFDDNGRVVLEKLTLYSCLYDGTMTTTWINESIEQLEDRCLRILGTHAALYYQTDNLIPSPLYIPKSYRVSTQIDRYMLAIVNLKLLKKRLMSQSEIDIVQVLSVDYNLKLDGKLIYKYKVDVTSWMREFLKSYRRMEGHYQYRRAHQCSLTWV